MGEKIFGDICNSEELNELANNLRRTKEYDEIRLLCSENGIDSTIAEEFIKGNRLTLVELGYLESRKALQSPIWQTVRKCLKQHMTGDHQAELIRTGMLLPDKEAAATVPEEPKAPEYTLEDVKEKLEAELKIYRDGDSKYVIEKLIECCQTDKELINCIMLPHKSYDKAFQYFYERSRTIGYRMPHGSMVYLDNDIAVKLSIEYFKKDDATQEKKKAETNKRAAQVKRPSEKKWKEKSESKEKSSSAKKKEPNQPEVKPTSEENKKVDPSTKPKPKPEHKARKDSIAGQLSFFDL